MKCILLILLFFVWFNGFSMAPGTGGPSHAYMHQMHGAHWYMEQQRRAREQQGMSMGQSLGAGGGECGWKEWKICLFALTCPVLWPIYCFGDYCSNRTKALVERQNELLKAITTHKSVLQAIKSGSSDDFYPQTFWGGAGYCQCDCCCKLPSLDLNFHYKDGLSPIHHVVISGTLPMVQSLVTCGAKLSIKTKSHCCPLGDEKTALDIAIEQGKVDFIKELCRLDGLERLKGKGGCCGAISDNLQELSKNLQEAFKAGIDKRSLDEVKGSLQKGLYPNFPMPGRILETPLNYVILLLSHDEGNKEDEPLIAIIHLLLQYDANPNIIFQRFNALHLAAIAGNLSLAKLLIKNKANLYGKVAGAGAEKNKTARELAIDHEHEDVAYFLDGCMKELEQKSKSCCCV